jgi:hypothetical protein
MCGGKTQTVVGMPVCLHFGKARHGKATVLKNRTGCAKVWLVQLHDGTKINYASSLLTLSSILTTSIPSTTCPTRTKLPCDQKDIAMENDNEEDFGSASELDLNLVYFKRLMRLQGMLTMTQ